jgi:Ca-activated chloride channel family protein
MQDAVHPQHPILTLSLNPLKNALQDTAEKNLQLLVRLSAPQTQNLKRTPLSLAIVIDRSGSMGTDNMMAALDCTRDLVNRLHDEDEVSVVSYDTQVEVEMELMSAREAKHHIVSSLAHIHARGGTDLHSGWLKGVEMLAHRSNGNRMCRVVLLSDGQANHGETNVDTISSQVARMAAAGITTSTVGIGVGFNEMLMTSMAIAGQGTAMYGDCAQDLAEPFDAEIGLLSGLAWREVTLSINSKTHKWNMHNDYARIRGSISPTWRMPSIAANSEAWMALSVPMDSAVRAQERHPKGYALELTIKAKDDNGIEHTFHAYLPRLPVLTASEYNALPTDEMVYRRFTEVESADLQRAARKAVQRRDWAQVQEMLDDIERRAFDNPWLQSTVQMLKVLLSNRDHGRMEKELMYASYSMKSRLSEIDEMSFNSNSEEVSKAAFLRRKSYQGRRSTP